MLCRLAIHLRPGIFPFIRQRVWPPASTVGAKSLQPMKPNFQKPHSGAAYFADVAADVRRLNLNFPPDTKTGNESQSLVTSVATTKFQTFHVNGSMPTARRERELRDFRTAARAVVSNARCLTEGVDVPAVDMVAFLSPRRSRVDIVQATGRAMRRSPGKTTGYVLLPLYAELTAGETVEAAVNRAQFDEVW